MQKRRGGFSSGLVQLLFREELRHQVRSAVQEATTPKELIGQPEVVSLAIRARIVPQVSGTPAMGIVFSAVDANVPK
jgi:hypothetical protein